MKDPNEIWQLGDQIADLLAEAEAPKDIAIPALCWVISQISSPEEYDNAVRLIELYWEIDQKLPGEVIEDEDS